MKQGFACYETAFWIENRVLQGCNGVIRNKIFIT